MNPSDSSYGYQVLHELEELMRRELFQPTEIHQTDNNPNDLPHYEYCRILNKSVVRLLTLQPGSTKDTIRGSLRYVPIESGSNYEALSYTWGSSVETSIIVIDGKRVPITQSLNEALLRLRRPRASRVLWVDALCINQADNEEKSLQVAIMHKIFSLAYRTLCWLGEDPDRDAVHTVELLRRIGRMSFSDIPSTSITAAQMRLKDLPAIGDPVWHAAYRFFNRPWFCRGWVIQEVVLSQDPTLLCGDAEVLWEELVPGLELLMEYNLIGRGSGAVELNVRNDGMMALRAMLQLRGTRTTGGMYAELMRSYTNRGEDAQRELNEGSMRNTPGLRDAVNISRAILGPSNAPLISGNVVASIIDTVYSAFGTQIDVRMPLLSLLALFPFSITKDPRDIYLALVNISSDQGKPGLEPDYTEPPEATILRFSRFFLLECGAQNHRSPLLTAGLAYRQPPSSSTLVSTAAEDPSTHLPSWIPQRLTLQNQQESEILLMTGRVSLGYHASGPYETSSSASYAPHPSADPRIIVGTGALIDAIHGTVPQPQHSDPPEYYRLFFQQMDAYVALSKTSSSFPPYPHLGKGETFEDVIWKTLVAGADRRGQIVADGSGGREDYERGKRFFVEPEGWAAANTAGTEEGNSGVTDWGLAENLGDWAQRWISLAGKYEICDTVGGLMGLVPRETRSGDRVGIIVGESMPFVLRWKEMEGLEGEFWEVIGACYLHGIMQGEAFRTEGWVEREIWLV